MENNTRRVDPILLVVLLFDLLLIVSIIVMIVNFIVGRNSDDGRIEINTSYRIDMDNFRQEVAGIDRNGMEDVSFGIYDIIWLNYGKVSGDLSARVREGSLEEEFYEGKDLLKYDFLVDVMGLDVSYRVNYFKPALGNWYGRNELAQKYQVMVYCDEGVDGCIDRYVGEAKKIIKEVVE